MILYAARRNRDRGRYLNTFQVSNLFAGFEQKFQLAIPMLGGEQKPAETTTVN